MRSRCADMNEPGALKSMRVCQACYDFACKIPGWLQVKHVYVSTVHADRSLTGRQRDIVHEYCRSAD